VWLFRHNADEAHTFDAQCANEGIPVIPRGAGSGLSGGALGIRACYRYVSIYARDNRLLTVEQRTVWVEWV
jgi:hypothetical protein